MINNIDEISAEDAKRVLAKVISIREDADNFDWESARRDPHTKYIFHSAAEKFGFDSWKYLINEGVIAYPNQQKLTV